ncbi:MAG: response regulator [Deltaproteobacteria bacterium]|nr:response regulator [Deltaproteobacteria bacterium]
MPLNEILIVDDDANFGGLLEEFLSKQGFHVSAVSGGEDAVEQLSKKKFDIALLDLMMPGMDGYEVMDFINDQELETNIIVMTGHATTQSAVTSLRKGVYDYLDKPFDLEELSSVIQGAIGKKRSKDEKKRAKEELVRAYNEMEAEIRDQTAELLRKHDQLNLEIKNRNRVEAAFRDSESKYKSLADNLNVGVYRNTVGAQGRFIEVNPAIVQMFGYGSRDEFIALNVSDLYEDPSQRLKFSEGLAKKGFVKNIELHLKRKDGTHFIGSVSAVAVKDEQGEIKYYDGIIEDITERKRADEVLIRNEHWYRTLTQIGLSLSAEKDTRKLLERIVIEARTLTNADAGTLYLLDKLNQELTFEIVQNDSMRIKIGGTSGVDPELPNVPLFINGEPNHANVSSTVALTGETINLKNVYGKEGERFPGPREYDAISGYHTKSMLVMPLKNHENEIIGVLQLLNAKHRRTGDPIYFSEEYVDLVAALASQAAVALTNAQLIENLNNLFYAFIRSIATAIDEKSPYTGGHINRVVQLSMMLAEKINQDETGTFKNVHFTKEELEELRLAAWMHDVGKVTTPENIVNKASKLETIFDRVNLIETRFALIASEMVNTHLHEKLKLLQRKRADLSKLRLADQTLSENLKILLQELKFIKDCNSTVQHMTEERLTRLRNIGKKEYTFQNTKHPYLTEDEIENLSVRYGNLTDEERRVVENHANMTLKILKQLSFPMNLEKVPEYAGGHHEKLDGSGYPQGLKEKDLPLQTRILAIVDIFEALTARDRPYREPMKLSEVTKIIKFMSDNHKIDPDLFDLLIESGAYFEYALKEMDPKQIDLPNPVS